MESEHDMSATEESRRTFTAEEKKAAAKTGHAMPNGSYKIENTTDLSNAIGLVGHSKDYSKEQVMAHIKKRARALGASHMIPTSWEQQQETGKNSADPPRDELVRALMEGGVELRDAEEKDGRLGTLVGHFATFNRWTKIDSAYEGKFMEQIAPGAFAKTFNENRAGMRALFQHGKDPQVGDKVLGPIDVLREDDIGAYYEVPLLDTSYNRDLIPGLEAGLYGASFRFRVHRQKIDKNTARSDMNPDGLPERTLSEVAVKELGPVTFPAYEGATAGMRSMTDEFLFANLLGDPERLRRLVDYMPREGETEADTTIGYDGEADAPPETRRPERSPLSGRRAHTGTPLYGAQRRSAPTWVLPCPGTRSPSV
jgi:HK97 family phage prohead protease